MRRPVRLLIANEICSYLDDSLVELQRLLSVYFTFCESCSPGLYEFLPFILAYRCLEVREVEVVRADFRFLHGEVDRVDRLNPHPVREVVLVAVVAGVSQGAVPHFIALVVGAAELVLGGAVVLVLAAAVVAVPFVEAAIDRRLRKPNPFNTTLYLLVCLSLLLSHCVYPFPVKYSTTLHCKFKVIFLTCPEMYICVHIVIASCLF